MHFLSNWKLLFNELFNRITKRDFSGNEGLAVRNSLYQFLTNISTKIFSLAFIMIMARVLLPELFGLYSLALSTILIFVAFSDLGIGETLIRFVSRELGRKNLTKAIAYSNYIIKIKATVTILFSLVLILLAGFISENYYHKPVYLALLAGSFYILSIGVVNTLLSILQAYNYFKQIFYREILFQIIRIVLVPLFVIFALRNSFGKDEVIFIIIILLALAAIFSAALLFFFSKKNILQLNTGGSLSKEEKKKVNLFIFATSATFLSGVFFGYIDIVMLGYFVPSEYIGYYQGAFGFVSAIIPLITFSAALLPVFSRIKKGKMEVLLKKAVEVLSIISIISFLILFFASNYLILLVLGSEYHNSINILRIFSLLLLSMPIITIYSTYFMSIGKPEVVSKSLIISTVLNVVLNYIFISYLLQYGYLYAVYGATVATIISRFSYMFLLMFSKKN